MPPLGCFDAPVDPVLGECELQVVHGVLPEVLVDLHHAVAGCFVAPGELPVPARSTKRR